MGDRGGILRAFLVDGCPWTGRHRSRHHGHSRYSEKQGCSRYAPRKLWHRDGIDRYAFLIVFRGRRGHGGHLQELAPNRRSQSVLVGIANSQSEFTKGLRISNRVQIGIGLKLSAHVGIGEKALRIGIL